MEAAGVRAAPDVDAIAVRSDHELSILVWNYHDDDLPGPDAAIQLDISGLALNGKKPAVHHYRIDETHSNAWTAWKTMGSPQQPTPEQYQALETAGQLQEAPSAVTTLGAEMKLDLRLPRQGISLLQLSW
jgi:xylan 1,4-beta-xylosidase